jgi:hypothetical protein
MSVIEICDDEAFKSMITSGPINRSAGICGGVQAPETRAAGEMIRVADLASKPVFTGPLAVRSTTWEYRFFGLGAGRRSANRKRPGTSA